jgi:hypothetical protein
MEIATLKSRVTTFKGQVSIGNFIRRGKGQSFKKKKKKKKKRSKFLTFWDSKDNSIASS